MGVSIEYIKGAYHVKRRGVTLGIFDRHSEARAYGLDIIRRGADVPLVYTTG